jgi:hypothetical protein
MASQPDAINLWESNFGDERPKLGFLRGELAGV